MSWLMFDGSSRRIELFGGQTIGAFVSAPVGVWSAHNDVASTSGGHWPLGDYLWSHYKGHRDQVGFGPGCFSTQYGCQGIHIFMVPGRSGMGVHAGRTRQAIFPGGVGRVTMGCIRTSEEAMAVINATHIGDPLVGIRVR